MVAFMSLRPVLQLEFNELSPVLLDRFIEAGELPNFKALRDASACFITDASGERNLEPWTQWPTLHTGMPDSEHGLADLGEGSRIAGKGIARELAKSGFSVGIFGAMNVDYGPLNGFTVPDPWNPGTPAHPAQLADFTDFVASAVQESSTNTLDKAKAAKFATFAIRNGLSPKTVKAGVQQLLDERSAGVAWKRPLILDILGFDVFKALVAKHEVAFATFFSNSTAHLMHYFWRNMEPDAFSAPPPATDDASLEQAVLTGYKNMDDLIGKARAAFPGWRLSLATALSQEAWDTDKSTWRPHDMQRILDLAGIPRASAKIQPVMAEQFFVAFADAAAAQEGMAKLDALRLEDGTALMRNELDDNRVKTGCAVMTWTIDNPTITGPGGTAKFRDVFAMLHGVRSGHHNPDGVYWVESSQPVQHTEKVPLTSVAPTVLSLFGVDAPAYMKSPALPVAL